MELTNPAKMRFYRLEINVTRLLSRIDLLDLGELILFASNTDKNFIEFDARPNTRGYINSEIARYTKFIEVFGKIIEKFNTFQVDFKKSPIEECVEAYFHKFTSLLVPGIPTAGVKEFMEQYREHNEKIKLATIKKAFHVLQMKRIDLNNARQKAWKKWLEFRGLLEDGIQLLSGLEAWKELVAERLSTFPLRLFKIQTVFPDTSTQEGQDAMKGTILKVIESIKLDWNAFKNTSTDFVPLPLRPLSIVIEENDDGLEDRSSSVIVNEDENGQEDVRIPSPVPIHAPTSSPAPHPPQLPPRFSVNSLLSQNQPPTFAPPNPSFSHRYSQQAQQPVFRNNPMQNPAAAIVPQFPPLLTHPIQAPFGYDPRMPPNTTRYASYPLPLMFNQNFNTQKLQIPNAPNHWNAPFGFPPMNTLPVLQPIQNLGQNYSKPDEVDTNTNDEELAVENRENEQLSPFINVVD